MWAGAEDYLMDSIQIIVNKAMRVVCKVGKSVRIKDLQRMTNWFSVKESGKYHSLMEARRILNTKQPLYLYTKLAAALQEQQHVHDTRHGPHQAEPRLALIRSSWLHRVVADMRRMPRDLLEMPVGGSRDKSYKTRLRAWVISDSQ